MLIAIIGESCTGKSTLADRLKVRLDAPTYTGKDYLRLAKNEAIAVKLFQKKLNEAVTGADLIYVISEPEHLEMLPVGAVRILMTAELELILERFSQRMHGNLPDPVKEMLKKKHGCFDSVPNEYHIHNSENMEEVCALLAQK